MPQVQEFQQGLFIESSLTLVSSFIALHKNCRTLISFHEISFHELPNHIS